MEWLRWYHGACSDSKWPIIARKSGQNIGTVVSIWAALLEYASQDEERGSVEGFDPEEINALFGYEDGTAEAVIAAMAEKGVISGSRIASWDKRQPVRERDDCETSTDRVKKFRQKQKEEKQSVSSVFETGETPCNANETPCNANETPCNANETPCNANETPCNANETPPDKIREDKIREDKINTPSLYNTSLTLSVKESIPLGGPPSAGTGAAEKSKPTRTRFQKPAVSEVEDYCRERGNGIDAQSFMDFYEAKGWLIGKAPMKDWRAAVRTWERREASSRASPPGSDKSSWQKDCPHFGGDAAGMTAKIPAAW